MNEQLITRYQNLVERRDQALTRRTELQTTLKHQKQEYQNLLKQLQDEFGVKSIQEGYKLRDELQQKLTVELDQLESALLTYENTLKEDNQQ